MDPHRGESKLFFQTKWWSSSTNRLAGGSRAPPSTPSVFNGGTSIISINAYYLLTAASQTIIATMPATFCLKGLSGASIQRF